jgi:hypothetical protein
MSVKALSDGQLVEAYDSYLKSDAANWTVGVGLLREISSRFGERFERASYMEGIKKVVAIKPSLKGREERFFSSHFVIPLPELKIIIENLTKDICLAAIENVNMPKPEGTLHYKLPIISDHEQYTVQIGDVLGHSKALFDPAGRGRLLTFGSCFAVNMGRLLRDKGRSVYTVVIAEDVNSPFNNLQFLKRVLLGETSAICEELQVISGLDYNSLRQEFSNATDIVFTLGNIFHLEFDGVSTLLTTEGASLVAETLGETAKCISEIFGLLQRFTKATIYVSVSPIPISGYRGSAFSSAIEADCVSKSQLRAALNACMRDFPDIRYIPTFEIFRWLPAHQAFPTFGTDDGNARHISGALLKRVLDAIAG